MSTGEPHDPDDLGGCRGIAVALILAGAVWLFIIVFILEHRA